MQVSLFEFFHTLFCLSLLFPELEAVEALKWLRAAGFPQYAQMFEGEYRFEIKREKKGGGERGGGD